MGLNILVGKFDNQIDFLPFLEVYLHSHYTGGRKHFHITLQFIVWYIEVQIGKDE
jgi:hypothetical protein